MEEKTKRLVAEIEAANRAYRSGEDEISDLEYDRLLEELEKLDPEAYSELARKLNEGASERGVKTAHRWVVGSLDKVKSSDPAALRKFVEQRTSKKLSISAKVDGISSVAKYVGGKLVQLLSRGDGYRGIDFGDKRFYVGKLPVEIDADLAGPEIYVRGEIVLPFSAKLAPKTTRRSVAAGLMNAKEWDPSEIEQLVFVPYTVLGPELPKAKQFELLEKLGFDPAWHCEIEAGDSQIDLAAKLVEMAAGDYGYECDGLVLVDPAAKNEVDAYRPKNMVAFKTNQMEAATRVVDVDWSSVSKDGFVIPVFVLEPVQLGGATVSRASAANLDVMEELGVAYGSLVRLVKANDVIPHVAEVLDNSETSKIELPSECPACGSKLVRDGVNLRCVSPDCRVQKVQQLAFFVRKLGVEGVSRASLEKFGIATVPELLAWKPDPKKKSEKSFYASLAKNVFTKPAETLLAATNFCGLAEKQIGKIVSFYGLKRAVAGDFSGGYPDGIGEQLLERFRERVQDNMEIVRMVIADPRYDASQAAGHASSGEPTGPSVCFTGKLFTLSRSEAAKKALAAGWAVRDGVARDLRYLVTNDPDSGSSKAKKAKQLGIETIDEKKFLELVSGREEKTSLLDL